MQLLEEKEEVDESEVAGDYWGDTQVLAGEAQAQV